eukprot:TRINITY_DN20971_c0_g1_i1.p1 TRINITY_DN20971_c0_g1~~TRINITY_DN20971_c0_g1_i1.p1  ORF type:complete len:791 (-),score=112.04 TRINITY_DN20971_c0_g1_i1:113-2485(-)
MVNIPPECWRWRFWLRLFLLVAHTLLSGFRGFLLLEYLPFELIPKCVFTYHYVLVIGMATAFFLNSLLQVFFGHVVPLTDGSVFPHSGEELVMVLYAAGAHFGLLFAMLAIGYKSLGQIADATIDAWGFSRPPYTTFQLRLRRCAHAGALPIFIFFLTAASGTVFLVFSTNWVMEWTPVDSPATMAALLIICTQVVYVLLWYAHQRPLPFLTDVFGRHWLGIVIRIRYIGCLGMVVMAMALFVRRGLFEAVRQFILCALFLVLPHIIGAFALAATANCVDLFLCLKWLAMRPLRTVLHCIVLAAPFAVTGIATLLYFWRLEVTLLVIGTGQMLIVQVIRHTRAAEDKPFLSDMVAFLFLTSAAHLKKEHDQEDLVKHMTFRALVRSIGTILCFALFALCLAVVLQQTAPWFRPRAISSYGLVSDAEYTVIIRHVVVSLLGTVSTQTIEGAMQGPGVLSSPGELTAHDIYVAHHEQELHEQGSGLQGLDYRGVCHRQWEGLTAMDYAWFSLLSYFDHATPDFDRAFQFYTSTLNPVRATAFDEDGKPVTAQYESDWYLRYHSNTSGIWAVFYDFFSPSRNLSVVAVRGTDIGRPNDILQDVSMYVEVGLYQILRLGIPGLGMLPENLVVDGIKLASVVENVWLQAGGKDPNRHYWRPIRNYVNSITDRTVVLTGHSMGGAIAKVAAVQTGRRAVAISSPGVVLSRKKFGLRLEQIHRLVVNVAAAGDIVPFVDRLGGEVHWVPCSMRRSESCHLLEVTMVDLWASCAVGVAASNGPLWRDRYSYRNLSVTF